MTKTKILIGAVVLVLVAIVLTRSFVSTKPVLVEEVKDPVTHQEVEVNALTKEVVKEDPTAVPEATPTEGVNAVTNEPYPTVLGSEE